MMIYSTYYLTFAKGKTMSDQILEELRALREEVKALRDQVNTEFDDELEELVEGNCCLKGDGDDEDEGGGSSGGGVFAVEIYHLLPLTRRRYVPMFFV